MIRRAAIIIASTAVFLAVAWLLALHRTYSPGPLTMGHAPFEARCASCHQPWRTVENTPCTDCHGDMSNNKHFQIELADKDSGLLAGKHLIGVHGQIACLSCHTDHRGRIVDLVATAGVNCAWCHQHDSIADVSAHGKKPMERPYGSRHAFRTPFSHSKHLALLKKKHLGLTELDCASCHGVRRVKPAGPGRLVLKWSGCAGSDCHVSPQDKWMRLPASIGAHPTFIAYYRMVKVRHINAVFDHSPGHLRSACSVCHMQIARSRRVGDRPSRKVLNCFACHAHQLASAKAVTARRGSPGAAIVRVALATRERPVNPEPEKRIVACAQCHKFHTYGKKPSLDFPVKAPDLRPHMPKGMTLTAFVIGASSEHGGLGLNRATVTIWWLGIVAFVAMGLIAYGWVRWLPSGDESSALLVGGPARQTEAPALDDTYQSNVPKLYVVGETAGTASINLAMRSGRQAIEFIANQLKASKPAPEPEIYDVAIVGCGPAGISAGTAAKAKGLSYVVIEKMTAASTIRDYPRGKFVQSTAISIDEYGSFFMEGDNSKEALLKRWEEILAKTGLRVNEREDVVAIHAPQDAYFEVEAAAGKADGPGGDKARHIYKARYVVLAVGVRGSPRRLGLPGETPDRVFYKLIEPEEYKDKNILVIGGGNAGAEVAQALSNPELRNRVIYSFRDPTLVTVTPENAEKISGLQKAGHLTVYPASLIGEIKPGKVVLAPRGQHGGPALTAGEGSVVLTEPAELDNDFVFAMLGAEPPSNFLKSIGIRMIRKGG